MVVVAAAAAAGPCRAVSEVWIRNSAFVASVFGLQCFYQRMSHCLGRTRHQQTLSWL